MRKIILNLCTSLDAFIEGANGEIDWCFTDQDYAMTVFLQRVDTIFFGRKSYEVLMRTFPYGFSDKKKVVFSRTIDKKTPNIRIISENLEQEVQKILRETGKDIWLFGGSNLIAQMLNLNLVDEMMIAVHPIILGDGIPLFVNIKERKNLKLLDTKIYSTGLVQLFYEVEKNEK